MIAQANISTFGKHLSASLLPCKPSLSDHNATRFLRDNTPVLKHKLYSHKHAAGCCNQKTEP